MLNDPPPRRLWADGRNIATEGIVVREPRTIKYHICIEGETEPMSTVTGSFTLVVNPGTVQNPLTITPSSGTLTPETEGVADIGQTVANVSGGVAPYAFSATGVPDGMDLKQQPGADGKSVDVILEGTPNAGDAAQSPFTMIVTVTDSATPVAAVARISIARR